MCGPHDEIIWPRDPSSHDTAARGLGEGAVATMEDCVGGPRIMSHISFHLRNTRESIRASTSGLNLMTSDKGVTWFYSSLKTMLLSMNTFIVHRTKC